MSQQGTLYRTRGLDWRRGDLVFHKAFPVKVPSVNHLFRSSVAFRKGVTLRTLVGLVAKGTPVMRALAQCLVVTRHLTREGRVFRKTVRALFLRSGVRAWKEAETPLEVSIFLHRSWWTKAGKIRRIDAFNREKALLDTVFPALDLEDSWVFYGHVYKVEDETEGFTIDVHRLVRACAEPRGTV